MIGKYLAEFAMTYKPTTHGKTGVAAGKAAAVAAPAGKWNGNYVLMLTYVYMCLKCMPGLWQAYLNSN